MFYSYENAEDYYYDEAYTAGKDEDAIAHDDFNHNRVQITTSGNLILQKVTKADKGSYVCRATNMVGSKSSESAILSVHGKS